SSRATTSSSTARAATPAPALVPRRAATESLAAMPASPATGQADVLGASASRAASPSPAVRGPLAVPVGLPAAARAGLADRADRLSTLTAVIPGRLSRGPIPASSRGGVRIKQRQSNFTV